MKIQRVETFTGSQLCMVRVTTDDGATGWGQVAPFHADITSLVLHRQIAPYVLGADPLDRDGITDRSLEANYKFPWSYVCRALSGVDTAIWDLYGRLEGLSVCELLGGSLRRLPVYGSSMRRDISPQDEAARLANLRESHGYRAFKVRVGSVCGHDQDQWPGRTEELIALVRAAIGPDAALLVDANSCYTPARAIEVGHVLEEHAGCHFEEPCPYWELEWTAQVAAALDIPVAGGEQDNDLAQWRRMIGMGAVDIVQPDVCYVGGLTSALRVAAAAAAAGIPCVPHSANHSMVTVFALHMMGAIANAGEYVECSVEPTSWTEGLFAPALAVEDGMMAIPAGPGWGVEIDNSWLERAERVVTEA
jgi:L-alanine-DL-glutamate epimerase-like enolase superfamily enzyme